MNDEKDDEEYYREVIDEENNALLEKQYIDEENISKQEVSSKKLNEDALKWLYDHRDQIRVPRKKTKPRKLERLYEFEKARREWVEQFDLVPEEQRKPMPRRVDFLKKKDEK